MVSRKRNKGKERKAKKAEKAANEAEIAWRKLETSRRKGARWMT